MINIWGVVQNTKDIVVKFRRELHQIPELGFDLAKTINKIRAYLSEMGIEAYNCGKSGLVAVIDANNTEGPVIGIRADMDGLPIQEKTGLEFSSK